MGPGGQLNRKTTREVSVALESKPSKKVSLITNNEFEGDNGPSVAPNIRVVPKGSFLSKESISSHDSFRTVTPNQLVPPELDTENVS